MRTLSKKQKATAAAVMLLTLGGTGTLAYAYWTTGGTDTGTAATRPGVANVLQIDGTTGDVPLAMYPGDAAQTIAPSVINTGSENYQVNTLKAFITLDAASVTAGCAAGDYLINAAAAPGTAGTAAPITITATDLAPGATVAGSFTVGFNNKTTVQDFCKGAVVTVNYVIA